jgi:hypothetical protein
VFDGSVQTSEKNVVEVNERNKKRTRDVVKCWKAYKYTESVESCWKSMKIQLK